MAGEPQAARVFFSYAGEDAWWIGLFRQYFNIGPVQILDYMADSIAFGPLGEALNRQIENSVVVVAFVSKFYRDKEWTVAEWESGLGEAQRRRLIFVPIMLDADAIVWWQALRAQNRLTGLSRDYQYANFTDGSGNYSLPGPQQPQIIRRIANLAQAIRQELARSVDAPAARSAGGQTSSG